MEMGLGSLGWWAGVLTRDTPSKAVFMLDRLDWVGTPLPHCPCWLPRSGTVNYLPCLPRLFSLCLRLQHGERKPRFWPSCGVCIYIMFAFQFAIPCPIRYERPLPAHVDHSHRRMGSSASDRPGSEGGLAIASVSG